MKTTGIVDVADSVGATDDVVIANGAPWPYFNVEPKRYRLRLLGGANARMWNMTFGNAPVYVIGSDDSYLDAPVKVNTVFMAPGERYDVKASYPEVVEELEKIATKARIDLGDRLKNMKGGNVREPGRAK